MSAGQPLLNLPPHFQHAAHPHLTNNSHLQPGIDSAAFSQSGPGATSFSSAMDPSQFSDFSFAYASMPGLADQSASAFDDPSVSDHFSLHSTMAPASVSGANMSSLTAASTSSFAMDPSAFATPGIDTVPDENAPMERHSPSHNSVGDSTNDDFGLSTTGRADGTDLGKSKVDKAETPAWSELKTKAGKDRKRLPLACIACRRKKIRCSGEKPSCKHCSRSRIPCVYKVTSRKAAPRTDYMAMLDKRLKRMEERIIKIVPKSEQDNLSPVTRAVVKPAIPGTNAASKAAAAKKRRADEAFSPELESWVNPPSKSKIGGGDSPLIAADLQDKEESRLLREGIDALPSKELQQHLAEVFFDSVYGQAYHLLHKPSFMRKLKSVSRVDPEVHNNTNVSRRSNSLPPVLVLSVCAVAARFSTNPKLEISTRPFLRGEEWAQTAREICIKRYEWPNMTILTCLLILGLHEFGTCHGGRSWALGGQAIRMAYALQLHKDLDHDPQSKGQKVPLSFVDREIRRRIMWACFLMDRFTSSGTDRPMFISDDSLTIPLPVSERCFQLDMPAQTELLDGRPGPLAVEGQAPDTDLRSNMGPSAFFIRGLALWGRVVTYYNHGGKDREQFPQWDERSQYSKLVRDVEELLRTLPPQLQNSKENLELHITERTATQYLFMHMTIHQSLLYVCQAAMSSNQSNSDAPKDFIPRLTAKTFHAANSISQLLKDADERQCFVTAPFAGYCAFSSSSVQIYGMVSGNPKLKAAAEVHLAINITYLKKMMKYWGMFHWMVDDIRRQYKNAYDASRRPGINGAVQSRQPLLQYADWFNRYPSGVSNVDCMDPNVPRRAEGGEDAVLEQKAELHSVGEFLENLSPASHAADGKDPSKTPLQKRKTVPPKKNAAGLTPPVKLEHSTPEARHASVAPTPRRVSDQSGGTPRLQMDQRKFSNPSSTQPPMPFNAHSMPAQSQAYMSSMSPISPNNMAPYQSQPQMPFFADIVPLGMGAQDPGIPQQMFGIVPGGMNAPPQDNPNGWQGMANGGQHNTRPTPAAVPKGGDAPMHPARHPSQQQNPMTAPTMNIFNSAPDSSWFMGYEMEPTEMNQDMSMTGNGMENFGMFPGNNNGNPGNGGSMPQQNHMGGGLQHGM
ncbi:zinc finger transcription factor 1 [Cordyceps fumosorosea ARSEF 2679]|uniref:Zinc finger transcription factor 1 n=1 Tax=Cordyceps fumosorosea (strain ARSEF 2679) TaxID=1081104 RepID=A0A167LRR1_CORFA|nr:zinc finger transcription factor 1 [Cordyceps fumosorosea ARSEF 2679]OAA53417.1 zinc finger transcription factor 1 [Cordyceps fumosorosea ARSEF 2679]